MTPDTLNPWLERAAGHPESGLRLLDRQERPRWASWAEIRERALEVCGGLQGLGVARGERVALVYPTGLGFFAAFFGILLAGAVPVPLYPPVRLGRLPEYHQRTAAMLRRARARLVLADGTVRRLLGEALSQARTPLGCLRLADLPAAPPRPVAPEPEDLALVQFSSGATGEPRAVALSHRAVTTQARLLNRFWPDTPEVRHSGVSWLPLYHDMGLIGCVLPALERPAVLTLLGPEVFVARPAVWLRAISRYRATISPAPNFAYALCLNKVRDEDLEGVDLSCWRVALNGAEPVVPGVLSAFEQRFARWGFRPEALTPVYGLSEAALAVTFSDPGSRCRTRRFSREALAAEGLARPDPQGVEKISLGRPLPGFELAISDPAGRPLPPGRVGRVWVRGPTLMAGYLDDPRATAEVLRGDWLDTGDLGFLDGGELYLTGRAKDVLILNGRNHAPEEVEQAVAGVPGVRPGCAVAASWLPEDAPGEVLVLFVETRKGVTERERRDLPEACRKAVLAACGLAPDRVVVLAPGTLPRTSSGKLRRQETVARYLRQALEPPSRVTPLRLAGALARSGLAYARLRWEGGGGARS